MRELLVEVAPEERDMAENLFRERLGEGAVRSRRRTVLRGGGPPATLSIDLASVTVAALTSIILLWRGRGRRIKLTCGDRTLDLATVSEALAEKLVEEFLAAAPSDPHAKERGAGDGARFTTEIPKR